MMKKDCRRARMKMMKQDWRAKMMKKDCMTKRRGWEMVV